MKSTDWHCESFRNRYNNVILQVCFVQCPQITRVKQKYSNDNQKAQRKIIELQAQNFIYSFQVKLNKTTYLSFKHIICRFMTESDNVTDNLVFAVNSLITLYQIRHFYLLAKWRPRCARRHARPHWHQRFRQKWDFCYNPYSVVASQMTHFHSNRGIYTQNVLLIIVGVTNCKYNIRRACV